MNKYLLSQRIVYKKKIFKPLENYKDGINKSRRGNNYVHSSKAIEAPLSKEFSNFFEEEKEPVSVSDILSVVEKENTNEISITESSEENFFAFQVDLESEDTEESNN